jgi:cbb3-type cytochrome oxidase subunit 3
MHCIVLLLLCDCAVQALMLSTAAREAVDEAAALKQHEAQQRAQLLGDLDSGRARLNRIQEGCTTLTVNKVLSITIYTYMYL